MKKKIIRVIARLNIGGPAIHVILLSSRLNHDRFETVLLSGREAPQEGNMLELARSEGVQPIIITNLGRELSLVRDVSTLLRLYRIFKKEKPDIVHTHTAKAGTVGRIAAILAGVPVIVHTFHGHVLHGYFGKYKTNFFRWIERYLAKWSTAIIAVSRQCKDDLIRYRIGTEESIRVIPLGLDLDRFTRIDPTARARLRIEWGIPGDAFLFGMIARMVPIKRHEDLFRAIPLVLRQLPDTFFVIVGDGELRSELEAMSHTLRIRHRCVFAGFRQDLEQVYQAVDAVVLTSGNEGLPVAIIESLSSGRPVVSTNVGGVPELIQDGKSGYLAEPYNIVSIAEQLVKMASDPNQAQNMGKIAQTDILDRFSIQRLVRDMEGCYEGLLKQRRG